MITAVQTFIDSVMGNIIGSSGSTPIWVAGLVVLMILAAILLAARLGFEVMMFILAPGIILAAFAGYVPMPTFGVTIIILGVLWAGIIMWVASR